MISNNKLYASHILSRLIPNINLTNWVLSDSFISGTVSAFSFRTWSPMPSLLEVPFNWRKVPQNFAQRSNWVINCNLGVAHEGSISLDFNWWLLPAGSIKGHALSELKLAVKDCSSRLSTKPKKKSWLPWI